MDIKGYIDGSAQRILSGELSSDFGSHLTGVYGKAAKQFEAKLRERLARELDELGVDYDGGIRPEVKGNPPPFDKLTLGQVIFCIRQVSVRGTHLVFCL